MSPSARRPIRRTASVGGTGLHPGAAAEATFLRAPAGRGVVSRRTALPGRPEVRARLTEVQAVERRTTIGRGEAAIHTIEHLLAAVAAHEIDDLTIELSGPELPILDGSVQPYYEALARADPGDVGGEAVGLAAQAPLTLPQGDAPLVGGPALPGARIRAHVTAPRPSHGGNIALARALSRAAQRLGAPTMDIGRIMDWLPHRYPFLLVDRIVEIEGTKRIVGIKNVTINEPFFQGHFPGHPIMPGMLIIEAMAQVGGMLLMSHFEGQNVEDKVMYFMSLDNVKFRRPVVPGDQIRFELEMLSFRGKTCKMKGVGYVEGQVVAEAEMMAMVVDK